MPPSNAQSRLHQVGPDIEVPAANSASQQAAQQALALVMLALKTLGQRTVIALSTLAAAAGVGSIWYLAYMAIQTDPTVHQLVALALYGGFVLSVIWIKR